MTLQGHVHNGAIVFDPPVALPEGATVQVQVVSPQSIAENVKTSTGEIPTLLKSMQDFVGKFEGLPPDASANHDHYLYGAPKRQ
jgi:hypothetical protein